MESKSDAELLQFCADELTQLVIEDVISTDAGNKVVVDTYKTLRAIASRLTAPSVEEQRDALLEACKAMLKGIEDWNAAVSTIVDCSHIPKWPALEEARAAIALAEQEPTP